MRHVTTRMAGLLILLGGIWGGLIPFVGPYFHFVLGPDESWTWTSGRPRSRDRSARRLRAAGPVGQDRPGCRRAGGCQSRRPGDGDRAAGGPAHSCVGLTDATR